MVIKYIGEDLGSMVSLVTQISSLTESNLDCWTEFEKPLKSLIEELIGIARPQTNWKTYRKAKIGTLGDKQSTSVVFTWRVFATLGERKLQLLMLLRAQAINIEAQVLLNKTFFLFKTV